MSRFYAMLFVAALFVGCAPAEKPATTPAAPAPDAAAPADPAATPETPAEPAAEPAAPAE